MKLLTFFSLVLTLFVSNAFAGTDKIDPLAKTEQNKDGIYKIIDADALKKMIEDNKNLVLIDSRGGKYFDGEVIKGAVQLSAKKTDEAGLELIAPEKDKNLVFYCSNAGCPASGFAAVKADKLGYKNIYKYKAGIDDWKAKGYPTMKIN